VSVAPAAAGAVARSVAAALEEDLGRTGDLTTQAVVAAGRKAKATFVAREAMTVAGLDAAREVFRQLDPEVAFTGLVPDGSAVVESLSWRR